LISWWGFIKIMGVSEEGDRGSVELVASTEIRGFSFYKNILKKV
jgi:hypothetical protein